MERPAVDRDLVVDDLLFPGRTFPHTIDGERNDLGEARRVRILRGYTSG